MKTKPKLTCPPVRTAYMSARMTGTITAIMVHNTAQNCNDNLHSSDVVCWR